MKDSPSTINHQTHKWIWKLKFSTNQNTKIPAAIWWSSRVLIWSSSSPTTAVIMIIWSTKSSVMINGNMLQRPQTHISHDILQYGGSIISIHYQIQNILTPHFWWSQLFSINLIPSLNSCIWRENPNHVSQKKSWSCLCPCKAGDSGGCIYVTLHERENPFISPSPKEKSNFAKQGMPVVPFMWQHMQGKTHSKVGQYVFVRPMHQSWCYLIRWWIRLHAIILVQMMHMMHVALVKLLYDANIWRFAKY